MALSLAIVFPVVLAVVMLVVQGALLFYAREAALDAARQGVDAGRLSGGGTDVAQRRAQQVAGDEAGGLLTGATATAASSADMLSVTVHGKCLSLLPGFSIDVSQTADAPVERFTTPGG